MEVSFWFSALDCEYPDHAALRHVRFRAHGLVQTADHFLGIDAPPGLHRDVLDAVDHVGDRHRGDAGIRAEFPEYLAGLRIERAEHAIARAAGEHQSAARGEHRAPVDM